MSRKKLFLIAFILVSAGEIVSSAFHDSSHYFFKPLILLTLIGYYLTSTKERNATLLYALFFCWIGDILLMFGHKGELYFILGLVAFLIAHLFYIFTFKQMVSESINKLLATQKVRYTFPIFLTGTGLIVVLYPGLGPLRIPVIVYASILMIMVSFALFRIYRTNQASFIWTLLGAVLFMVSDSILAINKFHTPITESALYVMTTYILAQFLIIKGLLKHTNS